MTDIADEIDKIVMDILPRMVAGVFSNEGDLQLEGTAQCCRLLERLKCPPIEEIMQSGVVPRFVEFLTRGDSPLLQFDAACVLTNITSGRLEDTKVIIDLGAIPILLNLLGSPNDDVRQQAVWVLGNIAGGSPEGRDLVLSHGALDLLISELLNENTKLPMMRTGTWALSNLCRGDPKPVLQQVKPALEALKHLVCENDEEVVSNACLALSNFASDGTYDYIQALIDAGVCKRLVDLLGHPSPSVHIPALMTIGDIATRDALQTQNIINHGVLPFLLTLLSHHDDKMKAEACWIVANILAGNTDQIQAVIEAGLIDTLVSLLETAESDIKKMVALGISNAADEGTDDQIMYLVNLNCIKHLCDLLDYFSNAIVLNRCLEGLENILRVGEAERRNTGGVNYIAQLIEAEGSEKIESLRTYDNNEIHEKVVRILETYLSESQNEPNQPQGKTINILVD